MVVRQAPPETTLAIQLARNIMFDRTYRKRCDPEPSPRMTLRVESAVVANGQERSVEVTIQIAL